MRIALDYHRPLYAAVFDPAHGQYWDYAAAKWVAPSGTPLSPPAGAMIPMEFDPTAPENRHVTLDLPEGDEMIVRYFERLTTTTAGATIVSWKYISHLLIAYYPGPVIPGAVDYRR